MISIEIFFFGIGVYAFLWWFLDVFNSFFQILWSLLTSCNQPIKKKYGTWAVITGSTDGIGKEYARALARHGINIVFIARNESKLLQVSNEIGTQYGVFTKCIVAHFSNGREIYDKIKVGLESIPVGILVNNVGHMYEYPDELADVPENVIWSMILTNIASMTMMTRILINDMKQRRKGIIVNVSSGTALQPAPFGNVYAASKSYVRSFTLALQYECKPYGIDVQLLSPNFVATKLNHFSPFVMGGIPGVIPNAETYGRSAVFTLGKTDDTTGYFGHAIQYALQTILAQPIRTMSSYYVARYFRNSYLAQRKQQNSEKENPGTFREQEIEVEKQ